MGPFKAVSTVADLTAATGDTTLRPLADAYTRGDAIDTNYGNGTSLRVRKSPNSIGFVRFRVPSNVGSVGWARLRLHVKSSDAAQVIVRRTSNNWNESLITARNKPPVREALRTVNISSGGPRWITINLSPHVNQPGLHSFAITAAPGSRAVFSSSETNQSPRLVVAPRAATPPPPPSPSQPAAPIRAAFFYPWFPGGWDQGAQVPYSRFNPTSGLYNSSHAGTIDRQVRQATNAGLEAFIASWWGAGHQTDSATQAMLNRIPNSPNPAFRTAVYYEPEGYGDPSPATLANDLRYLERMFNKPSYLRVNNKPVVFVWAESSDGAGMASRWKQAKARYGKPVHVVLKLYSGFRNDPNQPDSWHQYGPASPYSEHLPWSANVSPGFWHAEEGSARLGRSPSRFRADVRRMVSSGAFWQLVTSWNEWGEGTPIEPATQFGHTYLNILDDEFD